MALALAAVCGILATEWFAPPADCDWFVACSAVFLSAALISGRSWLLFPSVAMVFIFIHATRTDETFRHPLRLELKQQDKPVQATIQGSLLPDFDTTADGRTHALCTAQKIEIPAAGLVIEQPAVLLVRLPRGVRFPGAGMFELHGSIYLPRASSNPGAFDAQEHALRTGRVARFEADRMQRLGDSSMAWWGTFLETAEHCRQWISKQLTRDLEDDPQTAAVIRAMALGMSAGADDEIEDTFRNSGTLHVFAVSGLHVGLLGVIALTLLRQTGMRRGMSVSLMIFIVFAYAFVTGWRPSAARAAFMVAIFMCGSLVDRESSLQNSLGAAALLLLASDTHQLFMPGFQLSFGVLWISSAGSASLRERLMPFTRLDPFLPPQLASWRQRAWSQARLWLAGTLSLSFAAWIGSLPFILGHFQSVTPVAVIANCVLVPLAFLCLSATCLSLCAAALHLTGVQVILNNANWALAKAMIASAAWFAGLPGASFHFQPDVSSTHAPAVWRVLELPHGGAANHLRIGDSHWLFDTGDESNFRRVMRPYLHSSGVNTVTGVFLSHNDADHIGAVSQVLSTFDSPHLFCSTQEPGIHDSSLSTMRRLLDQAGPSLMHKLRVDERVVLSDEKAFKVGAQVLYPTMQVQHDRGDDRAMVLMLHLGPWRVLWLSDAGWHAEKFLCASAADIRCDVLIRSQHATDLMMTTEFLLKAGPQAVLCGSDARDVEAALPASLVEETNELGIPLLDTWTDGSIELQFQPDELHLLTRRSGRHVILNPRESRASALKAKNPAVHRVSQ
ncbi:ComEC/Rec2 family competence protein [Prosthecobacter sp.]|uniref:ComEC/Rec2 family competence protein n=1 Tax=Prosthecobacter sp. TaxID=1965333 RepID=UPI001E164D9D|nr:ComEC/Rec2 family competence protein [Prosthecobacter sp.]MCB1277572.1 ComEC/Rec2 family competence protein [Prosthecobacter sp.]